VAFIGGTGAGKSTLVRLLCGLDEPTEGKILFDDQDISLYKRKEIRRNVSCVLQKDTVFSGQVREMVGGGRSYSDEEVLSALSDAQIAEFFQGKEEGLSYEITERGGNLSGGQKQRLTIARAILKDAPLYIFDDSFSALDFMTERNLRERLKLRLQGKTQIIVTQRVSSARQCDKIFLFDGGKLVASGGHEELLQTSSTYREIYLSQTGGDEI
jgi:ABC-type multidrug transport system fused ATPase/permease subunit